MLEPKVRRAIPELVLPVRKASPARKGLRAIPARRGFRASPVLLDRRALKAIVDPKVRWVWPGQKAKPGPRVKEAPPGFQGRKVFKARPAFRAPQDRLGLPARPVPKARRA